MMPAALRGGVRYRTALPRRTASPKRAERYQ